VRGSPHSRDMCWPYDRLPTFTGGVRHILRLSSQVSPNTRFPLDLFVGIAGMCVACVCILFVVGYTRPPFDVFIGNNGQLIDTLDWVPAVAVALATVFGGVGLFALIAFRRRISPRVDERILS
jgi:hypothetical protein